MTVVTLLLLYVDLRLSGPFVVIGTKMRTFVTVCIAVHNEEPRKKDDHV